eukprot:6736337-Prymnesium_polylepis.1
MEALLQLALDQGAGAAPAAYPMNTAAPAGAGAAPVGDGAKIFTFGGANGTASDIVALRVIEHGVHKRGVAPDGSDEHVVSTLRPFTFSVGLYGSNGADAEMLVEEHDVVQLTAQLLFENGQSVATLPGSPAMTGELAMLAQGRATFKIRLN